MTGPGRFQTPASRADRILWHDVVEVSLARFADEDDLRRALLAAREQVGGLPNAVAHAEFECLFPWPRGVSGQAQAADITGSIESEWIDVDGAHLPPALLDGNADAVWDAVRVWRADLFNQLRAASTSCVPRGENLAVYPDYANDRLDLAMRSSYGIIEVTTTLGLADGYAECAL